MALCRRTAPPIDDDNCCTSCCLTAHRCCTLSIYLPAQGYWRTRQRRKKWAAKEERYRKSKEERERLEATAAEQLLRMSPEYQIADELTLTALKFAVNKASRPSSVLVPPPGAKHDETKDTPRTTATRKKRRSRRRTLAAANAGLIDNFQQEEGEGRFSPQLHFHSSFSRL